MRTIVIVVKHYGKNPRSDLKIFVLLGVLIIVVMVGTIVI
jgi:hypothetical protein